jgi:hypothetical protein
LRKVQSSKFKVQGLRFLKGAAVTWHNLAHIIHEVFEIWGNALKYNKIIKNPQKPSVFCTGWKACATMIFAFWRIIRVRGGPVAQENMG